jgi:hypothetical protein
VEEICLCDEKGRKYEDLQGPVTEALRKKKNIGTREKENGVKGG